MPAPRLVFSCLILDRMSLMVLERPDMVAMRDLHRTRWMLPASGVVAKARWVAAVME